MDSPIPLHRLEELPEARRVVRRPSRAVREDRGYSPNGIAAAVTALGALGASALLALLLY